MYQKGVEVMNLLEYVIEKLDNNEELKNNKDLFKSEIREVMQEIIMPVLSETNFFDNNVFLGGTALRLMHGLKRYSEDLDFTMKNNKIEDFSWKHYAEKIVEYGKNIGIEYLYKENKDKYGNKILKIRSDSILAMLDGKGIVPREYTNKDSRSKIIIKLETNYSVNNFNDEIMEFNKSNIRVFDLPSLFAGKINAVLTREQTNKDTNIKERIDHGRDWYDLIWYMDKGIKPNYDFLSAKLDYKGPFSGQHNKADINWVKDKLLKRMEGLNYKELNEEIESITLEKYRIILNKNLIMDKINNLG
jgi:predicted nucleotidyltransferase component of viral defense system